MKYNDCTDGFLSLCPEMFGCPYRNFPELFRPLLPLSCLPFLSLYAAMGACCPLRRPAPALLRSLRLPFFCVKISVFSTFCPPVRCVSCLCFSSCGVKKKFQKDLEIRKKAVPLQSRLRNGRPCRGVSSVKSQPLRCSSACFSGISPALGPPENFLKKVLENRKKGLPLQPRFKRERNSKFIEKTEKYKYKQVPRIQ